MRLKKIGIHMPQLGKWIKVFFSMLAGVAERLWKVMERLWKGIDVTSPFRNKGFGLPPYILYFLGFEQI